MKNTLYLILLSLSIFGLSHGLGKAQAPDAAPRSQVEESRWKLRADLFHQDYAIMIDVGELGVIDHVLFRPGIGLGGEYAYAQRKNWRWYQAARLQFHNFQYDERSVGLATDMGFEVRIWKGLQVAPRLGVAYNLVKPVDVRYRYEGDRWVKAKNTDPVFGRLQYGLGLDLSYRVSHGAHPIDVLANANATIIAPVIPNYVNRFYFKSYGVGVRMGL
jgi:hypothetical protein